MERIDATIEQTNLTDGTTILEEEVLVDGQPVGGECRSIGILEGRSLEGEEGADMCVHDSDLAPGNEPFAVADRVAAEHRLTDR